MEDTGPRNRTRLLLMVGAWIGLWTDPPLDQVSTARETLQAIGIRLSRSKSEHELTAIATRGDQLLGLLNSRERAALARGYLRFMVEYPVVVDVAVPVKSVPFWIGDQGFQATDLVLRNTDTAWKVYRKTFGSGWIGLGVNNLDRTPVAHYVVFVRPATGRDADVSRDIVFLDSRSERSWKTTEACPGSSAAHDAYKPFQAMPAELAGTVMLQPAHAERHSALLATGRVWKTHVVSSRLPDQVTIAFGSDPARILVWSWRTSMDVNSTALRLARAPAGQDVRVVMGGSTVLEVPNLLNDPVVRRHRVEVDGLAPDTVYVYSAGDGTDAGWGPWRTVKTGPDRARNVQFLYLGDAQTGLERWGRLLKAAYRRHPRADFVVMAGDLVDRGNERTNWDHFFLRAAGVFDRVPLMPCVGNHEYLDMGPRLYRAFFELPHNGPDGIDSDLVYHFECGDAFVAVLDSTLAVSDPVQAKRQAEWLDKVLRETRATWKFVIFHHPVYPSHPWRDSPTMREHWVPIFDKHHVDLVLQGHDHAYLRTYAMRSNHRAEGPSQGTIYLIAVSGDKFVDQGPRDYTEVGFTGVPTYQTIDIDAHLNRLSYRAWTEDGKIGDELTIDKARDSQQQSWSVVSGQRLETRRN
jgi:acid phosphatase type 7